MFIYFFCASNVVFVEKIDINKNDRLSRTLVINDHCPQILLALIVHDHYTYNPRKLKVR